MPDAADAQRRIAECFTALLDLPTAERQEYLEASLADDPRLRSEVESLLAAAGESRRFLEVPALRTWAAVSLHRPLAAGDRIGPWVVMKQIGEGGMGAVFLAERVDDEFRQKVAIKITRLLATGELRRRFLAERQILADLDHPHIARLLEGGTTDSGLPYLVMEYIEGTAIDVYCDRRQLSRGERIELFQRVCAAVQYAHRSLVVHRDLKPSNILITAEGAPKLLDFGIAKLLRPPNPDGKSEELTRLGDLPLTPNYASPEQLLGQPITTASDVYSLGVLLYRLLTGRLPRTYDSLSRGDVDRALHDHEPARPGLDRDLDRVLLRALNVEPHERYGTVESFTEDLERHRLGQPVRARPLTFGYRTAKFLRRHFLSAAAALAAVFVLVGFSVDKARQAGRLALERDHSQSEEAKAQALSSFLIDLLQQADPWHSGGEEPSVRQVLDRGVREIRHRFTGQDEVRAALLDAMGISYVNLGHPTEAAELLEAALALRREVLPAGHPDLAASLVHLGTMHLRQGDYDRAEAALAEAVTFLRHEARDDGALPDSLEKIATLRLLQGDFRAAEAAAREALVERLANRAPVLDVASSQGQLAIVLLETGALEEAGALLDEALQACLEQLEEGHPRVSMLRNHVASLRRRLGDLKGAEAMLRSVLASRRRIFEEDHLQVSQAKSNLAGVLTMRGQVEEAEQLYREVLESDRKRLGADHRDTAVVHNSLGRVLRTKGDLEGARRHHQQSLAIVRRSLPASHPGAAYPLLELAAIEMQADRPGAAEPLIRRALELRLAALPASHPSIAEARQRLGGCLLVMGRYEDAETLLRLAFESVDLVPGQEHTGQEHAIRAGHQLVELYQAWQKPDRVAAVEQSLATVAHPAQGISALR